MKKIFVLFVMFLFVFSTIAIAEDENETSDDSSGSNRRCRGGCPQFMPPAPDFCKSGTIVSGGDAIFLQNVNLKEILMNQKMVQLISIIS